MISAIGRLIVSKDLGPIFVTMDQRHFQLWCRSSSKYKMTVHGYLEDEKLEWDCSMTHNDQQQKPNHHAVVLLGAKQEVNVVCIFRVLQR